MTKEEALPEIGKFLRKQKTISARQVFIETLEKEHKVIRSLEPLRFDVSASHRPAQGSDSAPVLLVLFSDFQCPYCKEMSETLREVMKNYEKKVRAGIPADAAYKHSQICAKSCGSILVR